MGIAPLTKDNHLNSDSLTKATILSYQFRSVFTKEDNTTRPSLDGDPYSHLPPLAIHVAGIEKLLHQELPVEIAPVLTL